MEAKEVKQFLLHLAECASKITLPGFRTSIKVTDKSLDSFFDPVTDIDLRTEKAIAKEIKIRFPEHGISGEEYGAVGSQERWSWIIDPIDGTRSFISGMPTWGTLIGLLFEGKPVYGMMSQPYVGDCFIGGAGVSELYNAEGSQVLKARPTNILSESILFSTTPEMFQSGTESDCFTNLAKKVKMTRFGADCYGYCLLASGFVDLVVESNLKYCDIAPLVPIIEASGGAVSHWDGNSVKAGGQVVAASTQELLDQALELLANAS